MQIRLCFGALAKAGAKKHRSKWEGVQGLNLNTFPFRGGIENGLIDPTGHTNITPPSTIKSAR